MAVGGSAADIAARLDRLPSSRPIWGIVVLLSLGGAFEFYDLFMTAYISPGLVAAGVFRKDGGLFGLSDQATFAAATFAGLFIGTMVFSQLADRFGRRSIFTWSLLWYTVATVAMAFQTSATGIHICRLISGIGIGVEMVTIDIYITEFVAREIRGKALAINQAIQFLAVPAVALTCYLLLPLSPFGIEGWRWVFLGGTASAVVVWFIRARVPESPRWLAAHGRGEAADRILSAIEAKVAARHGPLPAPTPIAVDEVETAHGRFTDIFRRPYLGRTVMLAVFNIAQTIGFYGFGNWAPSLLAAQGVTVTKSLLWSFVIAIAYPIGPLVCSAIADRFERKWQIVAAACGTATFGLLFMTQRSAVTLIALGVMITLSNNLLSYAYHAYQAELYPTRIRARAVGFVYSWSRLSTVFHSFIIAFFLANYGAVGVFVFIAGAMAVVVGVIGGFGPRTRHRSLEEISGR